MCDPTLIATGFLTAGSFAATTAIAEAQRKEANAMMDMQVKSAEAQAKRAEDLMKADAVKPRRAKPEEALYGKMAQAGTTTLTGPQGTETAPGQLAKTTLLGG